MEAMLITVLGGLIGIVVAKLGTTVAAEFLPFTPIINPIVLAFIHKETLI